MNQSMKERLQHFWGQLQFRLFLSHVVVAVLTAVSVTVIVLTFTRTAAGDLSLETYRLVAFDYAKMWLCT